MNNNNNITNNWSYPTPVTQNMPRFPNQAPNSRYNVLNNNNRASSPRINTVPSNAIPMPNPMLVHNLQNQVADLQEKNKCLIDHNLRYQNLLNNSRHEFVINANKSLSHQLEVASTTISSLAEERDCLKARVSELEKQLKEAEKERDDERENANRSIHETASKVRREVETQSRAKFRDIVKKMKKAEAERRDCEEKYVELMGFLMHEDGFVKYLREKRAAASLNQSASASEPVAPVQSPSSPVVNTTQSNVGEKRNRDDEDRPDADLKFQAVEPIPSVEGSQPVRGGITISELLN